MKVEIISQKENPYLEREEFEVEVSSDAVPSSAEVISEMGKDASLAVVKKINTNFGRQKFLAEVFVYNTIEDRERIEVVPQKVRKKIEAEKKKAAEEEKKKKLAEEAAKEEAAKEEAAKEENKEDGN